VPLAALGAVLVVVCLNMAEFGAFRAILNGPRGDMVLLLLTFGLTVLVDLSTAIAVGVVLSAFFFMHRMTRAIEAETGVVLVESERDEEARDVEGDQGRRSLPRGVEVFSLNGPFFFGAAAHFEHALARSGGRPRVMILRMENVPLIDTTGSSILQKFLVSARSKGTSVILSGLKPGPAEVLRTMRVEAERADTYPDALEQANALLQAAAK
jgi:SulP family sulfate permease